MLPLFELVRALVGRSYIASFIVNANHSPCEQVKIRIAYPCVNFRGVLPMAAWWNYDRRCRSADNAKA